MTLGRFLNTRAQPDWVYEFPDRTGHPNLPDRFCRTGLKPDLYFQIYQVRIIDSLKVRSVDTLCTNQLFSLILQTFASDTLSFYNPDCLTMHTSWPTQQLTTSYYYNSPVRGQQQTAQIQCKAYACFHPRSCIMNEIRV